MDARLAALVTLLGSLIGGAIVAALVSSFSRRVGRQERGLGRAIFILIAVVGVVAALAFLDEEAVDAIPEQALSFVPRLLGAGVLLVVGWILAGVVGKVVDQAISRGTGRSIPAAATAARWSVLGTAIILALGQLGIETLFLIIATTIALATVGLILALLTASAGRDLATQAAQGRYVRRHVKTGDHVAAEGFAGKIVRVDAASTVLSLESGEELLVPNSHLMDRPVTVKRA